MQAEEHPRSRAKSALREFAETVLFTLLVYLVVRTFLFENYRVVGSSMESTLQNDQFLMVNKLLYRLQEPQRGDIIVFRDPRADDRKLIKRLIGMPGETVEVRSGKVLVNGVELEEPYVDTLGRNTRLPSQLTEGEYFVLGDNRNNSSDSRSWGALPEDNIVGKAWLSYWPPAQWGVITHEVYGEVP
jgi:signal peptidase I